MPMKPNRLSTALVIITFATCLISCKKETASTTTEADYETTFELSSNQAIADNLTEDANNVFMEAASDNNLLGSSFANQPVETSNI